MKRILAAAALTITIFALSFYGKHATESSIRMIQDTVMQIDTALADGNSEHALTLSRAFLLEWEKHHDKMCLFLQHEHLDPLENIFALLPYYIEQGDIVLARAECLSVRTAAEHLLKTERLTLENIL